MPVTADPNLNRWQSPNLLPDLLPMKVLLSGLVKYDENTLEPVPDLARSWDISPDGLTYTFTLREDVRWHDGTPLTAEDVKYTYDFVLDPSTRPGKANIRSIQSTEVVDPSTVRFNLSAPQSSLLTMTGYLQFIMPKHILEPLDWQTDTTFVQHPIGTGPYRFKEQVTGSHVELVANDDYFLGRPNIDTAVFKTVPDVNTQVALLKTGALDFMFVEPTNLSALQNDPNIVISKADQVNFFYAGWNNSRPMFKGLKTRQALIHAIDQQAIIQAVLSGYGDRATGPISPALKGFFDPSFEPPAYDPELAKRLLAEDGWVSKGGVLEKEINGQPVKFSFTLQCDKGNPSRERATSMVQQYWKAIGADVTLELNDWATFNDRTGTCNPETRNRDYWYTRFYWQVTPPTPDLISFFHSDPRYSTPCGNYWQYENAEVDRLLIEIRQELNRDKQVELTRQLTKAMIDDPPMAFLYYPYEIRAVPKKLQNFSPCGIRDGLTHIEKWWIE